MSTATPRTRRFFLGAFGDAGHAFPMIALGKSLVARGHDVTLQTWEHWREQIIAEGIAFAPAPEYRIFPEGPTRPLGIYEAAVPATAQTLTAIEGIRPDIIVADILTLAPALAAELAEIPFATLIPHVNPQTESHFPIYSIGARLPRTLAGRALWRRTQRPIRLGLLRGRSELNHTRAQVGLPPIDRLHGGISTDLVLVATFPQLEYPRRWPANTHVVGPMMWEPPSAPAETPPGEDPLILIATSTAQDPEHVLLANALDALADAPVRVIATWNRRIPRRPLPNPTNAIVVDWLSYAQTMPACEVVVCHAGHGTLVRALSFGCAVVACPHAGDMNENAARLDWAGAGVRLPRRFISPRPLRHAVERALNEPSIRAGAKEIQAWSDTHDPGRTAAELLEAMADTA